MTTMRFSDATDAGLAEAMARDGSVLTWGENVRLLRPHLLRRFGAERVVDTPISEGAFLHAGLGAAMAGRRPVAEVMLADLLATAWPAMVRAIPKITAFTGRLWPVPLVVRATCGGGYSDGGQHEQTLWGSLGNIPGLTVVVPSEPADAAALMLSSVLHDGPVVFLEHRLFTDTWLDHGLFGEPPTATGVPAAAVEGEVPEPMNPATLGTAVLRRAGNDVALVSVGAGVHRSMAAADHLAESGVDAAVLDLRGIVPLDRDAIVDVAGRTGRVVVVDEDYVRGGLSGEVAAVIAEGGVAARYARVAVETTVPFATRLGRESLPSVERIIAAVGRLDSS